MASKLFLRLQGRALALHQDCHALVSHGEALRPREVHRLRVNMKELRALWHVVKPFTDSAAGVNVRPEASCVSQQAGQRGK